MGAGFPSSPEKDDRSCAAFLFFYSKCLDKRDEDGHLFSECTFPPLQHVRDQPEFAFLMSLDRSKWPRCFLWHGCLDLMALVIRIPGLPPLVFKLFFILNGAFVLMLLILLVPGLLLRIGMLLIFPWRCLSTPMFGLMVAGRISLPLDCLRLLALVFICLLLKLLLRV